MKNFIMENLGYKMEYSQVDLFSFAHMRHVYVKGLKTY